MIYAVAISKDGKVVAAGGGDGAISAMECQLRFNQHKEDRMSA